MICWDASSQDSVSGNDGRSHAVRKEWLMNLHKRPRGSLHVGGGAVLVALTASLVACSSVPTASYPGAEQTTQNPYAPKKGGHRHWIVPTQETAQQWRAWKGVMRTRSAAAAPSSTVLFGGGINGIGVTSGVPR